MKSYLSKNIDKTIIFKKERWAAFVIFLIIFIARMVLLEGYYAIAYILGFNYLQCVIYYLTPLGIPSSLDEEENGETVYDIPESFGQQ